MQAQKGQSYLEFKDSMKIFLLVKIHANSSFHGPARYSD